MIKAIFFDFDGVLFDLEPIHYQAWIETIRSFGKNDPTFILDEVIGISDATLAERFLQNLQISSTKEALCEKKRVYFNTLIKSHHFDMSQEKKVLESLSRKYFLSIVSSSHTEDISSLLQKHKLSPYFSFIIGGNSLLLHKPDPAPYLMALKRSAFDAKEVIAIEDSEVGLQAATKANLHAIWMNRFHANPSTFQKKFQSCSSFEELLHLSQEITS